MIDRYQLDDMLAEWHKWCRGFSEVRQPTVSAMFAGFKQSRQWDSEGEVVDSELHNHEMKALDFHINELCHLYRTALQIHARNLVTGRSVWTSERLPKDQAERQKVLSEARTALIARLG